MSTNRTASLTYCSAAVSGSMSLRVTVSIASGATPAPDLTTATSATVQLTRPDGTVAALACDIESSTATSIVLTHAWVTGDLTTVGVATGYALMVCPAGTYPSAPFQIQVTV